MDGYYIQVSHDQKSKGLWLFEKGIAKRTDISNPEGGPNTFIKANFGEPILDALKRVVPAWFTPEASDSFHKTALGPGEYFPRMARPSDHYLHESPGRCPGNMQTRNEIATTQGQLIALTRELQNICQTVHPSPDTFDTYGHAIRNLLILACTEVEAHWRGVLLANGIKKEKMDTRDYVKLAPAMRLSEYAISFPFYPWLEPIKPFESWGTTGQPTKEINWYDDYHAVKHDREQNFARATVSNAFNAVAACAVMMCAQFGSHDGFGHHSELRYFFELTVAPNWPPSDVYIFPYSKDATPKNYFS